MATLKREEIMVVSLNNLPISLTKTEQKLINEIQNASDLAVKAGKKPDGGVVRKILEDKGWICYSVARLKNLPINRIGFKCGLSGSRSNKALLVKPKKGIE